MKPSTRHGTVRRWLSYLCLGLVCVSAAARAAEPKDVYIPLDERLLGRLEATTEHLAAREKADPALKKDFQACGKDKKISGETMEAISADLAARHPRLAAALSAEGWKAGDFYLTYGTVLIQPYDSELSHGGEGDTNKIARRNVVFYDSHKDRILALIGKMNTVMGVKPAKD